MCIRDRHIAALLPADVLARYHRAVGDKVCFVSGSDCHGTPEMCIRDSAIPGIPNLPYWMTTAG